MVSLVIEGGGGCVWGQCVGLHGLARTEAGERRENKSNVVWVLVKGMIFGRTRARGREVEMVVMNIHVLHFGTRDLEDPVNSSWVQILDTYCVPNDDNGLANLISFIYPPETLQNPSAAELQQKAIICPKNDAADTINKMVVDMVGGPVTSYASYDTATPQGNDGGKSELLYLTEYLNTLNYPGLPPHLLELKIGVPAILLRNISVACGLCNGTRMIVTQLLTKAVEAEIITGTRVGEKIFFPRMNLIHKEPTLPYVFKRQQFPLKVSYAMTINKSQGQSLNKIGIYLPKPIFSHGQLYVALLRATLPDSLRILIRQHEGQQENVMKNIVYTDFLSTIADFDATTVAHTID
ncbi:uncharacterized protein [Rutidosis leptorrhynchoides]|uniref:uncharacterized protein n=1 Tax=Rutidosis leptorrhynchoides TaxID=125765 RepID=UPI003A99F40B